MSKQKLFVSFVCLITLTSFAFGEWQKLDFNSTETLHHVRFANENVGWVLGEEYLYKTVDGGTTWIQQKESLGNGIIYVKDENTIFLANYEYNEEHKTDGILRSINGGENWTVVNAQADFIDEIDFVTDQVGYAGGSDPEYKALVKKTTDGGNSWVTICDNFPGCKYEITGISFVDENIGWAVTYGGVLYSTSDGGNNWTLRDSLDFNNSSLSIRDLEFVTSDKGMIIGGIAGCGMIWTTQDGGETWIYHDDIDHGNGSSMDEVQFLDENTCWMVGYGMPSNYSVAHTNDFAETLIGEFGNIDGVDVNNDGFTSGWMVNENLGYFITNIRPDYEGSIYKYSKPSSIDSRETSIADRFELYQNYPNPFNPSTTISFSIPKKELVKINVYDIKGNLIESLVNEYKNAGTYFVRWNAENFSTGLYIYEISAGDFNMTKKCMFVK